MTEAVNTLYSQQQVRAGLRWFGPDDIVTIENIRQTPGITNVITALHHIAPGEVWSIEEIAKRKIEVEFYLDADEPPELEGYARYLWYKEHGTPTGLFWCTAESLVFTEEIKNGSPLRDSHISNYKESLKNLGRFGVTTVVGNFMLVADWTRTAITRLDDGSTALSYDNDAFMAFDIFILKRHPSELGYIEDGSYSHEEVDRARHYYESYLRNDDERRIALTNMITAGLPGAQEGFTLDDFRAAVRQYEKLTVEDLRENILYFLNQVIPVAKDAGVQLCCHIDDPAFSPFLGTPRAIGTLDGCRFLLDQGCGINLCVGSLLPNIHNRNISELIYAMYEYGAAIGLDVHEIFPHIHLRPIATNGLHFTEGHHAEHREELAQIVYTLTDIGWKGVFRPDHAPSPTHGFGRPGYDLVGRGYGAQLLLGLFEMADLWKRTKIECLQQSFGGDANFKDTRACFNRNEKASVLGNVPRIKKPWALKP